MIKRNDCIARMWFVSVTLMMAAWSSNLSAQGDWDEWLDEPVYRWDMPDYNRLNIAIMTEVESQGSTWKRPDCSFQAAANVFESRIQMETGYAIDVAITDKAHYWDLTKDPDYTRTNYDYWEHNGPISDECAPADFGPNITDLEKCPRLPFFLKKNKVPETYNVRHELCTPDVDAGQTFEEKAWEVRDEIKRLLVYYGPLAIHFQKVKCGYWEGFYNDYNTDVYVMDQIPHTTPPCDLSDSGQHWVTIIGWNDNVDVRDPTDTNVPPAFIGHGAWLIKDSVGKTRTPPYDDYFGVTDNEINPPGYWWYAYPEHNVLSCNDNDNDMLMNNVVKYILGNAIQNGMENECIVYVKENGGSGPPNGDSWLHAVDPNAIYPDETYGLQWAINKAQLLSSPDLRCEVWVQKGEYKIRETLELKGRVNLVGGFEGTETVGDIVNNNFTRSIDVDDTILRRWGSNDNSVVEGKNGSIIDGFTIKDGNVAGSGGGLCSSGGTFVKNCHFVDNYAGSNGGGMYSGGDGDVVYNCTFITNEASNGGGIASNNSDIKVGWAKFLTNEAAQYGGGAYNKDSDVKYLNCEFHQNKAVLNSDSQGGGMYNLDSDVYVTRTTFWKNRSEFWGSAIFNQNTPGDKVFILTNSTIYGNISNTPRASAMHSEYYNGVNVLNSIFWNNLFDDITYNGTNQHFVIFNDLEYLDGHGYWNMSEYPEFANPLSGDFSLTSLSLCIDNGVDFWGDKNSIWFWVPRWHDKSNRRKLEWARVGGDRETDIGAYDWYPDIWTGVADLDMIIVMPFNHGSTQETGEIASVDTNNLNPIDGFNGKDHVWGITSEEDEKTYLTVKVCPDEGDAILAFYDALEEMMDMSNNGGSGECEILTIEVSAKTTFLIDIDTYGGSEDALGEYTLEISWNPGCGCFDEWISEADNGDFTPDILNGLNAAPWQYGTPSTGPGACYGGSGECWATNLTGNYNNNANECIETTPIDLSICGYNTTAVLDFMHWYNFENGYDGANLEAWDGYQWNIIDPVGGYPDDSVRAYGTSVHGMRGYSSEGMESTWHEQTFYVQGYSNPDFKIRLCFGSDDLYRYGGWYIDDVTLQLYDGDCGGGCYETLLSTDFNSDDGNFIIDPDQQLGYSWDWGTPTGDPATGADGDLWATNPAGDYNVPEDSCIRSPEINMSSCLPWQNVEMTFDHYYRFWHNLLGDTWDGAQVQAWNGVAWQMIDPVDGYPGDVYAPGTTLHGQPGYTDYGPYSTWHDQTFDLSGFSNSDFQVRFCMVGDYDPHPGWYIDNVKIEGPPAPNPDCQPGMVLYSSDFESDNGGFSDGLWDTSNNNSWAYGTATNGPGSCHGGDNCWATNLTANYSDCEDSYISKSLDLSACGNGLETVYLVYWHWFEFEENTSGCDPMYYDGYTITWSGDGQAWTQPETSSFISGGFNTSSIEATNSGCPTTPWVDEKPGYEDSSGGWVKVVVPIPADVMTSDFELRFAAGADGSANEAGAYIDDVCIAVGDYSLCE